MKTSEGEMLWYESARLAHGRPKPLQGKMYVIGSCEGDDDLFVMLIRVGEDLLKNTCSFGTCAKSSSHINSNKILYNPQV